MANRLLFTVPNPWPVIRLAERISLSASYECQGVTGERARAAGERWCSRNFRRLVDKKKKRKEKGSERGERTKSFRMESGWILVEGRTLNTLGTGQRFKEMVSLSAVERT